MRNRLTWMCNDVNNWITYNISKQTRISETSLPSGRHFLPSTSVIDLPSPIFLAYGRQVSLLKKIFIPPA
jgi:hypothetical protein